MKKMLLAALAAVTLIACSGERDYLKVKGLSIGLAPKVFADSMLNRGFQLDSAHSSETMMVFVRPDKPAYSVTMACDDKKITAVEEDYRATYNDSTRGLWQELRDGFVEELGRQPGIPKRNDDHKIAEFETSEYKLVVTLDNRSVPFLSVFYEMKDEK